MTQRRALRALVGILTLAAGLRLVRLGAQSLWYDETVSVYLAGRPLPALIAHTAGDIHPPGYYLLLHGWTRLAGSSELAAAYLSLLFGLLLVALGYRLGRHIFGRSAGLSAAFLVAISPFNVWYSQEVRMYTVGAALGMGTLWCVVRLITRPRSSLPGWPALMAYAVLAALGLWMLYYFAFLLVALNLLVAAWWLVERRRRQAGPRWLARWLAAQVLALVLVAPWLPVAWRQATSPPVPPWRSFASVGQVIVESWSALSLGQSADPVWAWPALLLTAALCGLGLASGWLLGRGQRRSGAEPSPAPAVRAEGTGAGPWILAGYVAIPVCLIWLASLAIPLYHVRYVFTYSTPFYVLAGAGLALIARRVRLIAWACLAVLVAFSAVSGWAYHTDAHLAADDHRRATQFVQEHWRPGDAILVDAGYVYPALLTYWQGEPPAWKGRLVSSEGLTYGRAAQDEPVLILAGTVGGDAQLGWGDPASDFYAMPLEDAEAALQQVFADFHRVWVYRCYDTVTDPQGDIRRWLEEHGRLFEDQVFTGEAQLRVQGYLTGRDPLVGMARVQEALADGSLSLAAQAGPAATVPVGGSLDLALAWSVGELPADGRILFAGLFSDGHRWAQADVRQLGSLYPFDSWERGEITRTPLRLRVPEGTPTGRYRVEIGWYRFVEAQPVWLPWGSGNLLLAGEVEVVPPADWWAQPLPDVRESLDVVFDRSLRLHGVNGGPWSVAPGEPVWLELVWLGLDGSAEPAATVVWLADDAGGQSAESPTGVPRPEAGQSVRATHSLTVPPDLPPGTYNLLVGLRRADGSWLPVRRGLLPLGTAVPVGTVRVLDAGGQASAPGRGD